MKNLIFTEDQLRSIYILSYSLAEAKGKKRQQIIDSKIIESLKNSKEYEGCVFKSEYILKPLWGKYFAVDVAVFKNDNLIEIILAKAPASNIKQNKINNMNSLSSDIERISKYNVKVSLINFLPNETPYFTKAEKITKFEKNRPEYLMKTGVKKDVDVDEIFVTFTIDSLFNCKTKSDLKLLFETQNPIKNIKIEEFNYIK